MIVVPQVSVPVCPAGGDWLAIVFAAGQGSSNSITLGPNISFIEGQFAERHLQNIKTALSEKLRAWNLRGPAEQVRHACPSVTIDGVPGVPVKLSVREQRSWELGYVLSCLASVDTGSWPMHVRYWASGEFKDFVHFEVHQSTFEKKLAFIARSTTGGAMIFAPLAAAAKLPPGLRTIPVATLDSFRDIETLPLARTRRRPDCYSAVGTPEFLTRVARPLTQGARQSSVTRLASALNSPETQLIQLVACFQWGKSTLIKLACEQAGRPVQVAWLDNAKTRDELFQAVSRGWVLSVHDVSQMTSDPLDYVQQRLGADTTLILLNANSNDGGSVSNEVVETVSRLVQRGVRCLVESRTSPSHAYSGVAPGAHIRIFQPAIPALPQAEVAEWAAREPYEFVNPSIAEVLGQLDGHPGGIHATLESLLDLRAAGETPDDNDALECAAVWVQQPAVDKVVSAILPLSSFEKTWFALMWPLPLPSGGLGDDDRRRLSKGFRFGLFHQSVSDTRYAPSGWLHLHCLSSIHPRELVDRSEILAAIPELDAFQYRQLTNNLRRYAATSSGVASTALALVRDIAEPAAIRDGVEDAYVPALDSSIALGALSKLEPADPGLLAQSIWLLENVVLGGDWPAARQAWSTVLEFADADAEALAHALSGEWSALRSLWNAYTTSPRWLRAALRVARRLSGIVLRVAPRTGSGHQYFFARLAMAVAADTNSDESAALIDAAEREVVLLTRFDPPDPRASNRHELELELALVRSRRGRSREDVRAALEAALRHATALVVEHAGRAYQPLCHIVRQLHALEPSDKTLASIVSTALRALPLNWDFLREFSPILLRGSADVESWLIPLVRGAIADRLHLTDSPQFRSACSLQLDPASFQFDSDELNRFWSTPGAASEATARENILLTTVWLAVAARHRPRRKRLPSFVHRLNATVLPEYLRKFPELADALWIARLRFEHARAGELELGEGFEAIRRSVQRQFYDANRLCAAAIGSNGGGVPHILSVTHNHHSTLFQRYLIAARSHPPRPTTGAQRHEQNELFFRNVTDVMLEFEKRCRFDPIAQRHSAMFHRYRWNHDAALNAAVSVRDSADSLGTRLSALRSLCELLAVRVYSPTLFRSPHIALANSKDEALMKECALELSQLSSPTPDLAVLMQGLRPDARIWLTLAESIETRFGAPSEFWERIVRSFSEERSASDVFDMTNVDVLRMVATPLRWAACEIEALDRSSRIRLAEASIQCALGALRWQRGNGLVGNISLEFEVACSIAAAIGLKGGGDPVLLGSEVAPTGGRRGQTQSWRVHALYLFRVVIEEAQSRFSKHARAVRSAVIEAWTEAETRRGVAE